MEISKRTEKFYYVYRILALLLFMLLFLPSVNPARISTLISKSTSLLTTGLSYGRLIENLGRPLKKLWVLPETMKLLRFSVIGVDLGIIAAAAGACLSPGNHKCKRLGNILSFFGSILSVAGMFGVYQAYTQISQTKKPDKIGPMLPGSFIPVLVMICIMLLLSVYLHFAIGMFRYDLSKDMID